jgi:ATP-dependent Lhr-like helicase
MRRLDAERRLKEGSLRALVATASLELGIDIGDVDLAIQVGAPRSIATFLQRIGRAGHSIHRVPKGRLFPLTLDELGEAAALLRAVRHGVLDRTPQPRAPLDILAQQMVAACVPEVWEEDALYHTLQRAWPYRDLPREDFEAVVKLHSDGRRGLLHHDGVGRRLRARRRARIAAITCGGAIPDTADYQVRAEPDGLLVGTLNEDFAVESNVGDIFQLGNASWRVLKVEPGIVRVADAKGSPPTLPFWLGEAPGRTRELSHEIGGVREACTDAAWLVRETGMSESAAQQLADYLAEGRRVLGSVPTQRRVILERFFDESGGMQLIVHALFGARINRAWGLALRKRFCRGFGFELQAAANEEAILISLGPQHSFPLEDVFSFLHPDTARDLLIQALLDQPMFEARWRWNTTRALLIERMQGGQRVPAPLIRMRANDLLVQAFPQAVACPETLPGGDLPVPMDHPLVRQTVEDCLHEAMDVDGFLEVLRDLRGGALERLARDTVEPSAFAHGVLSAHPYAFLDDAPLEERRAQAVLTRRTLDARTSDELGALDPDAVQRVRDEAWPHPENADEVHEALLWMGYVTTDEARDWQPWLDELKAAGRVRRDRDCWFATEATRDPKQVLRGRLEALGPVFDDDPRLLPCGKSEIGNRKSEIFALIAQLEGEGIVLRTRLAGRQAWCERRLLARIHRYTLDRLRSEIEPVSAAQFLSFLACWQHVDEEYQLEGPRGVSEVIRQLAGFEIPAAAWEASILPSRVRNYRREWLDELTLLGEVAWGRLWGSGATAIRATPIGLLAREDLESWLALADPPIWTNLSGPAREVYDALTTRGPLFAPDLQRVSKLLWGHVEMGLAELIGHGVVTCDSFAGLRQLITPPSKRPRQIRPTGRWSLLRPLEAFKLTPDESSNLRASDHPSEIGNPGHDDGASRAGRKSEMADFLARQLLRRTGVVFRRTLEREKLRISWYELVRVYRRMELRGEVRGGRFVAGFSGEQYALPEAVELLRKVRKRGNRAPLEVRAADPLNFQGILTPEPRVASTKRERVKVG